MSNYKVGYFVGSLSTSSINALPTRGYRALSDGRDLGKIVMSSRHERSSDREPTKS